MKERKCFNCKEKGYTIRNYLKKVKIFTIIDASNIDDIQNVD